MYQEAMAEWKAARKVPEGSAEEYHEAMETLTEVGIPMADALAERLGSHVVILVVGPVGSEKGERRLTGDYSVFSDTSNLQTARTWAQFDHKGFSAMENSITRYGRAAFSKAECQARAWPPLDMEGLLPMEEQVPPPPAPLSRSSPTSNAPPTNPNVSTKINTPSSAPKASPAILEASTLPSAPSGGPNASSTSSAPPNTPPPASDAPPVAPNPADTTNTPSDPAPAADDGVDRFEWSESLVLAHTYLSEKKWGPRWTTLVEALVKHEWSFWHQEEHGNLPKGSARPQEFADWMKEHRVYGDYPVSAKFGDEMLAWWKYLGPPKRWEKVEASGGDMEKLSRTVRDFWVLDWCKLQKQGRNGPALLGQSIRNAAAADGLGAEDTALEKNELWNFLVEDVCWVLTDVLTQSRETMEKAAAEKAIEEREAQEEAEQARSGKKGEGEGEEEWWKEGGIGGSATGGAEEKSEGKHFHLDVVWAATEEGGRARRNGLLGGAINVTSNQDSVEASNPPPPQQTEGPNESAAIAEGATDADGAREMESTPSTTAVVGESAVASGVPAVILPPSNAVTPADRASSPSNDMDIDSPATETFTLSRDDNMLNFDPFANDMGYTAEELQEMINDPGADDEEDMEPEFMQD
ncbi:hypothetical protein R3P38DRAFT_2775191 [Favolaschia claudopus]|uniref:Uncharacterized protein n=1 Tax=Favolaschia claudopus TaxID=2862362 RepID=A0AAW0BU35_9AGAR